MPLAVAKFTEMVLALAGARVTVKVALVVPPVPSIRETLLIARDGGGSSSRMV